MHGRIEFDRAHIEDFVILRSDGHPTYHLSVVVDDIDMAITHVVRGDDHISNTPKHVLLFEALGAPVPRFAHVPLILGADKKRLSKRHGATSVMEYAAAGLPAGRDGQFPRAAWLVAGRRPRADVARRSWSSSFALEGISGGNAVFNTEKLDWMNGQYIARMPLEQLARGRGAAARARGLMAGDDRGADAWLLRRCSSCCGRARSGSPTSSIRRGRFCRKRVEYEPDAVEQAPESPATRRACGRARRTLCATSMPFDEPHVEAAVRRTAEQQDIKAAALIHATRVAVTGRTASPGIFEVLVLLGPRAYPRPPAISSHRSFPRETNRIP